MSLTQDIRKDMMEASKKKEIFKADILKLVLADIRNEEVVKGEELNEEEVIKVVRKLSKKVQDSIEGFTKMNRGDLIAKEKEQLEVLNTYLPALMPEEEIQKVVNMVVNESVTVSIKDIGMIMGKVMKELGGKADGKVVREIVQKSLS